ncbi:MAG: hypothetical protein AAGA03_15380 [Planctomycetota bacterium]
MSASESALDGCYVAEQHDGWLLVVADLRRHLAPDVDHQTLAWELADLWGKASDVSPRCVLAPASTSCFFARVPNVSSSELRDRVGMRFQLEEYLPLDAEAVAADFRPLKQPGRTANDPLDIAAVAVPVQPWAEISEAIESHGIAVEVICPRAVLISMAAMSDVSADADHEWLIESGPNCDWLRIEEESITAWKVLPADSDSVQRHLRLNSTSTGCTLVAEDLEQADHIQAWTPNASEATLSATDLALLGAAGVLRRPENAWINLRCDALSPPDRLRAIRGPLTWLMTSAILFLVVVAASAWWRTRAINAELERTISRQRSAFQEAFPQARVPASLMRRVRSEHTKALRSRGQSTDLTRPESAPRLLRTALNGLPEDIRFQLTRVEIRAETIAMDLGVRRQADAGRLAESLAATGFQVDPPTTRQSEDQTYQATLRARWPEGTR